MSIGSSNITNPHHLGQSYLSIVVKYSLLDLYADDAEMHCSHLCVVEAHLQSDLDDVTQ